jgi:uncharacterized membrane protein YgaE (UPF0421/DUF939 family)
MNRVFHKMRSEQKLGLRIIKTGIAVTICVAFSNLLRLDQPYLALIATVLSMGKSVDMSVRSGKNKMIGVLIGSALGCGFAMLSSGNAGLCGIGIIAALYLCQLLRLDGAAPLTCFAFAAVMFSATGPKPWQPALMCAENALLGIAVAVVVNLLVIPPNYAEEIKILYAALRETAESSVRDAEERRATDVKAAITLVERLEANVRLYVSEAKLLRGDDDEVFAISCKVATYRALFDELKAVEEMQLAGKEEVPEDLRPIYKYHMERARRLLESTRREDAGKKKRAKESGK